MSVKTVLCYGDSNTWGADPATGERFDPETRWPGVLGATLGSGYRVIEEGLSGRTTVHDDPIEPDRNGLTYLRPCLESHRPLDLVIVMLGTNDLKARFRLPASDIAQGAARVATTARQVLVDQPGGPPVVLLVAPPPVATLTKLGGMFAGSEATSRAFARQYRHFAGWAGIPWFDAGSVIRSSDIDGIHLEADQHCLLGEALAGEVRQLLTTP
ncbi:MAG: SGNH/GDSL hydrolase family protein [Thermomicrobiales bacterium]